MKRILLIICILNLLFACGNDEKGAYELTVNPSFIEHDSTESIKKVYVVSNTPWEAVSDQSWCEVQTIRKFGNDTVAIKVFENTGFDERIAYVSFGNPEKSIIATVKIIQKPRIGNFSGQLIHGFENPAFFPGIFTAFIAENFTKRLYPLSGHRLAYGFGSYEILGTPVVKIMNE
jgi:hypothetical protein